MHEDIKEECGVAAVSFKGKGSKTGEKAVYTLYKLLLNMQNRGQLSAGITTYNAQRNQILDTYKSIGTVNEVFRTSYPILSLKLFKKYAGNKGIGSVRYATCGSDSKSYAMPFERHHGRKWKWFSFAFNGNIANYVELKNKLLQKKEYHIIYDIDTEIIMHYIAKNLRGNKPPELKKVFHGLSSSFDGAYNLTFIDATGNLAAVRDPKGFRPLCYGEVGGSTLVASETNALFNCGVKKFKFVKPGEMLHIYDGQVKIEKFAECKKKAHCMFEWVYFANVASVLDDKSVYLARTNLGKELAKAETEELSDDHVVVPVPDSSKPAGDSMAYELGLPTREGLIRNRYVGRTFIEGSSRDEKVRNKFTALREILKGKKVLLVDDSLVRGTTSKKLIRYLKKVGGAKEVHFRVSCPPIVAPCFYGIDMSTVSELMASKFVKNIKEEISDEECGRIAKDIGADSLIYNTKKALVKSIGLPKEELCMACLNGEYPTPCGKKLYQKSLCMAKHGKCNQRTYE